MNQFSMVGALLCVAAQAAGASQPVSAATVDDPLVAVRAFVAALSNADLEAVLSTFAEDASVFMPPSVGVPARLAGKAAIRENFRPFLERLRRSGKGPPYVTLTPTDVDVQTLDADASVVTFHLGRLPTEPITERATFSRRTFVLRRTETGWQILHLHASSVVIEPTGSAEEKRP